MRGAAACGLSDAARGRASAAARVRARRCRAGRVGGAATSRDHRGGARRGGDDGAAASTRRASRRRRRARPAAAERRAPRSTIALDGARPAVRAGLEVAIANVRAVAEAGLDEDRARHAARGADGHAARGARAPGRRSTRPAAATRIRPRSSWARSRRAPPASTRSTSAAAPHPSILAAARAVRGRRRLPRHRRAGDRRARLRHRDDPAGRRDRRPGQPVGPGGQAAGGRRRRHRRVRRAARPDGDRVRRAPTSRRCALDLQAQAEHGEGSLTVAVSDDAGDPRRRSRRASSVLADDMDAALAFAEALAPEHLQLAGDGGRGARPARAQRRLPVRRQRRGHRVRRLRRGFEPHAARPRAPRASPPASTSATSGAAWPRSASTTPAPALARRRAWPRLAARAEGFRALGTPGVACEAAPRLRQNPRP